MRVKTPDRINRKINFLSILLRTKSFNIKNALQIKVYVLFTNKDIVLLLSLYLETLVFNYICVGL